MLDVAAAEEEDAEAPILSRQQKAAKRRRQEQNMMALFAFEQAKGAKLFLRWYPRLLVRSFIVGSTMVYFVVTVYPARGEGVLTNSGVEYPVREACAC